MSTDSNEAADLSDTSPDAPEQSEAAAPVDARDILRRWWTVVRWPGIATFDVVQEGASWQSIIIQTLFVGLVGAALSVAFVHTNLGWVVALNVLGAFLGLVVIVGLLFAAARLFGGKGRLLPFAYVVTLIYVPVQLAGDVLGIVPYVGPYVLIALFLYQVLLSVFATASVHRLPFRRAGLAVLITYALLLLIGFIP